MAASGISSAECFGGRLLSRRSAAGIELSEVEYGDARRCPRHAHARSFFSLLLRGGYADSLHGFDRSRAPFDLAFHPAGIEHADEVRKAGTRFLIIELEDPWVRRLREHAPAAAQRPLLCDPRSAWTAVRLYREHRDGTLHCPLLLEGMILEMLGGLAGSRNGRRGAPRWLGSVLEILHEEFDRPLTLERIAREVGLHPVHLSRAFRDFRGEGIGQYLAGVRVRFAAGKLARSAMPIAQIALLSGFSDQSHFTRVFRRHTGFTPGAFRHDARVAVTSPAASRRNLPASPCD